MGTYIRFYRWSVDGIYFDIIRKYNTACLCHGDFRMPNLIIDFWKSELAGAVDPFDMLWAEPEYEIFCLTLGFGEKLKLFDEYKKRNSTSKYCDLKVELYVLCVMSLIGIFF